MRLVRFGQKGNIKPGLWKDGNIVDLREIFPEIPDISETFFREGWLEKVAEVKNPGRKIEVRIASPIHRPSKIICLGKNYAEHAKEGGFENPEKPLLFCKTPNALSGPYDPIILPRSSGQVDWEVELAVIIGKEGKRIAKTDAFDYVAGFTVMNDVSGRQAQFSDSQWFRGKSFDSFAPAGPFIVTPDEIDDVNNLRLTAVVDGEIMQDGNTRDMIFDIRAIIENISEDITLIPGDIISTGTPAGVGIFRDPPVVLKPGNVVECRIEQIGAIINKVVDGQL
ncbi:MAG: fumarylacetoacetate hydrolase family protein [Deltaproteobacteria bacterium]|nr:fumarylacetoacetate hydrolase family protein [Deltaproteobacteria bacterium]MBW2639699.1 fumarylacetoacetate hydrolase family protein [Deltaproteobacteria bacterium]MBW2681121.1 fumarylacetoacetate hydrolase family protein [Deltaproteobacteria bacterium]